MKVVITQASYGMSLLQDYPYLNKYKDYYIDDDPYQNYDYWRSNCIVAEMTNDEMQATIRELIKYHPLVVGYADKYNHEKYGIDFEITIYDDYLE